MFVAERFLSGLIKEYGKYVVSTDGGAWYLMACKFLRLKHIIILHLRKASLKGQFNILRTGPKVSMTTFPVGRNIVTYIT